MRILALQFLIFCAWASGTSGLPQQTTAPDIEVLSKKWVIYVYNRPVATGPAMPNETIQREGKANDPMPVMVPNPNVTAKPTEHRMYTYSAEIRNRGPKVIKALKWSYVFSDPVTDEELKRQSTFSDVTIRHDEKKTLLLRTPLSPPLVVNANSPNATSPFAERVIFECVLFADGSLWSNPQAKAGRCDNLRGYKPR
jgi:hypothetical protein